MSHDPIQLDVLVLGDDLPAAAVVLLLREKSRLHVGQASVPGHVSPDRLTWVNPSLFNLHPALASLRKSVPWAQVHGMEFFDATAGRRALWREPHAVVLTSSAKEIAEQARALLAQEEVRQWRPKRLAIAGADDQSVRLTLDDQPVQARLLILSNPLPLPQRQKLAIDADWPPGVLHRRSWIRLPLTRRATAEAEPLIAACLNLDEAGARGWLLPGPSHMELAVDRPLQRAQSASMEPLLKQWADLLREQHILTNGNGKFPSKSIQSVDLPLAGALSREPIAKQTLLIGSAGGFISAWGGEVFPGVASAVAAAAVAKKALRETHLQDALQPYRSKWRTTLGDYLRPLEQELPLLMPLVFRTPAIGRRLAEAILLGQNLVR
jgi:hypothetical protein